MFENKFIIGLTGGIGAGKTIVAKVFSILGIPIYFADKEAKNLYFHDEIRSKVINLLGPEAYTDQNLNKTYISNLIFNNPEILQSLNHIIHPAVREHFNAWAQLQSSPYVIQESAIIFETGISDRFDYTILVTAPQITRINRVMSRDGISQQQVLARINNQMPESENINKADFIIDNDNSTDLFPQVIDIHQKLYQAYGYI